jgi:hypothetical protein
MESVELLRQRLPQSGKLPKPMELRRLSQLVLLEHLGREPLPTEVTSLVRATKRHLKIEAEDSAYINSLTGQPGAAAMKQKQTGGGDRIIRKPGGFGG